MYCIVDPEAEYIAMCEACSDIKWLGTLMTIEFQTQAPSTLFCDNTASNTWAQSSDSMRRAKHIDLKYHFLKESFNNGHVKPTVIDSEDNPADALTEPLMKAKFEIFRNMIYVKPRI